MVKRFHVSLRKLESGNFKINGIIKIMGSWFIFRGANLKQKILFVLTFCIILFYLYSSRIENFATGGAVGNNRISLTTLLNTAACSPGDSVCEDLRTNTQRELDLDTIDSNSNAQAAVNRNSGGGGTPLKAKPGEPIWHFSNYRPYANCPDCLGFADEKIGEETPGELEASSPWIDKDKRIAAARSGDITSVATNDFVGRKTDLTPDINWLGKFCLKDPDCLGMQVRRGDGTARMVKTITPLVREDPEEMDGETTDDVPNFHDMYILHPYRALKWQIENKLETEPFRARIRRLMWMGGTNTPNCTLATKDSTVCSIPAGSYPRHDDDPNHDKEDVLDQLSKSYNIADERDTNKDGVISEEEIYQWEVKRDQDTNYDGIVTQEEITAWEDTQADTNNDGQVSTTERALWEKKKEILKMRREAFEQRGRRRGGGRNRRGKPAPGSRPSSGGGGGGADTGTSMPDYCRTNFTADCVSVYGSHQDYLMSEQKKVNRRYDLLKAPLQKQARAIITMLMAERNKIDLNASIQAVVSKHGEIKAWEAWTQGIGKTTKDNAVSAEASARVGYNGALTTLTRKNKAKTDLTNYYNEAVNKINYWVKYAADCRTNATAHHNSAVWWHNVGSHPHWGVHWSRHYHTHYTNVMNDHINNSAGEYQVALTSLKAVNQAWGTGQHVIINGTNSGKGWGKTSNAKTACEAARDESRFDYYRGLITSGAITGKTINDLLKCKVTDGHYMNGNWNRRKYTLERQDGVIRRELGRQWRTKLMHQGKRPTTNEQCGYNARSNNAPTRKTKCGDCYQDDTRGCKNVGTVGPHAHQYWKITYWQGVVATWHGRLVTATNWYNHHVAKRDEWNAEAARGDRKAAEWVIKRDNRRPGMDAAVAAASIAQGTYNWHHTNLVNYWHAMNSAVSAYNNGVAYLGAINVQMTTYRAAYDALKLRVDNIETQIATEMEGAELTAEEVADIYQPPTVNVTAKSWTGDGCHVTGQWRGNENTSKQTAIQACNDNHGPTMLAIQGHECALKPGSTQTTGRGSRKKWKHTACPFPG